MDTATIERVCENLEATAHRLDLSFEELIVFSSRTRVDYRPESDVDIVVVSPDFDGIPAYRRPKQFYRYWDYDTPPDPEFICLTPGEFEAQKAKQPHIVRTAVEEGVSVL